MGFPLRRHFSILILLACYLVLAVTYSVVNPPFEAPDEIWHYAYVHWFAEGNGLPQKADFGVAAWAQEGSQPPLYYLAAALPLRLLPGTGVETVQFNPHAAVGDGAAFGNRNRVVHDGNDNWPWRGAALGLHLTRFFSIVLGAVTVFFTYAIGRTAVPGWPAAAPLAAALVAFNPQFLFIHGAVTNDVLVTAGCTAGLWLCVWGAGNPRWSSGSRRLMWWTLLGLLAGLAALSKLSGLLLTGLVLLTLAYVAVRARAWRQLFVSVTVFAAVALAVAGWWYWRNWQLFGDPTGLAAMVAVLPGRDEPAAAAELLALAPGIWRSVWAVFGWFNVVVAEPVHWFYTGLAIAAAGGWLALGLPHRAGMRHALRGVAVALLALWLLVIVLATARWAQINHAQGRLLFPAIASLAVLLAVGILAWWPARRHGIIAVGLGAALAGLAAAMPFTWIVPAYAPPAPLAADVTIPNARAVRFDNDVVLLGYTMTPTTVHVGDAVDVTLFWRADAPLDRNYSVFLHGTDTDELLQLQRDSYPGSGNLPTRAWAPGAIYPDRHRLVIPPNVMAPAQLRIDVGLYDVETGVRLTREGDNAAMLGTLAVAPRPGAGGLPHVRRVEFDGKIALLGFDLDRTRLAPGESLELVLWWEALRPLDADYVVFAHLILPPDAVWAQQDQMPQAGGAPTSTWVPGTRVEDRRRIELPASAPPGNYQVAIGLYDKDSYERLPVNFDDRAVILAQVKVEHNP